MGVHMSSVFAKKSELRLTLDGRKRVSLAKLLPDYEVCSFKAFRDGDRIILEPMAEIPARDMKLYRNPHTHESVQRALDQAEAGFVKRINTDFSKYIDENI